MSPSQESPSALGVLGRLPAELRNEIYNQALTAEQPIEIWRVEQRNVLGQTKHKITWVFRSGVLTTSGKKPRRKSLKKVLVMALFETSSAIQKEAFPVFCGGSRFDFNGIYTLDLFSQRYRAVFELLTQIGFPTTAHGPAVSHFECLRAMTSAKRIEVCFAPTYFNPVEPAEGVAKTVWKCIKPLITAEKIAHDNTTKTLCVALPEELQVQRLDKFHFSARDQIKMEFPDGDTGKRKVVRSAKRRNAKLKGLVLEMLRTEAEQARAHERKSQAVINEMLRSGQSWKAPDAARKLAFETS